MGTHIRIYEEHEGSVNLISSYRSMFGSLNENIAAAKTYMQKLYAKDKSLDYKDLSQEEKEEALKNKGYQEIIKLIGNHHGYAAAFVKFHFDQDVPINLPGRSDNEQEEIRDLASLLNMLLTKKQIVSKLPMNLDQYSSDKEINGVKGFEALSDAIRTIQRADGAKWFIERLPKKSRDGYRNMSDREKNEVINAAYSLEELGSDATSRLLSKIKAMDSWSIEKIMEYVNNYLSGYSNLEMKKKIDRIAELEPDAGVLYYDDKYLVLSIRTEMAQKELCSIANWCINRGSWWQYNDKGIQINIFDYTRDQTDPYFLTGTTIYTEGTSKGKVNTSHDINDALIRKSSDPREHFTELGYPNKVVDAIMDNIDLEMEVKFILRELGLNKGASQESGKKIGDLIVALLKLKRSISSGNLPEKTWSQGIEKVSEIIANRLSGSLNPVIKIFLERGILSEDSLVIFETIVGKNVSKDEMQGILKKSIEHFESMQFLLDSKFLDSKQEALVGKSLESKDRVISKLKSMI